MSTPRLASLELNPDTCATLTEAEQRAVTSWLRRLADEMEQGRRPEGVFVLPGRGR
jgi:hypothetical protein